MPGKCTGNLCVPFYINKISELQASHFPNESALSKGIWVKIICGASNEDLPSISDLCALYAAAGVHCIDVAADMAVVTAAKKGLDWIEAKSGIRPWLMVSISDGKDIHFRKAFFDNKLCPKDCSRPCQKICPAEAIKSFGGVLEDRCYGCGRCLPICPLGLIQEKDHYLKIEELGEFISQAHPDAIEIHTAPGRIKNFETTMKIIAETNVPLKRIAVSCGLEGHTINPQELAHELWQRHSCIRRYDQRPIWQLDGRPMSGDLGKVTAKSAIYLWQKLREIAPPGPIQLAGGTNAHTIDHIDTKTGLSGIAFGGKARKLIQPFLIEAQNQNKKLIDWPEGWNQALKKAKALVNPWLDQ